jgi:hypothetical protein
MLSASSVSPPLPSVPSPKAVTLSVVEGDFLTGALLTEQLQDSDLQSQVSPTTCGRSGGWLLGHRQRSFLAARVNALAKAVYQSAIVRIEEFGIARKRFCNKLSGR